MSDGTGSVTISVDDNKNKSYDPTVVTPDKNNNIVMTLKSIGKDKTWTYKDPPITIKNDADFTPSVDPSGTVLTVKDSEADRETHPKHKYTVHVQSSAGDSLDIDPIIKDRV